MSLPLPSELILALQAKIDAACDPTVNHHIPGVVSIVVDSHGAEKFAYASGTRGVGSGIPMDVDSIFWIASCTKLITSIACLQLVEEGLIDLDDVSSLEALLPELKDVQVLEKEGDSGAFRLVPKERRISLRMLLSHTAGFSYSFFHEALRDFSRPVGFDEFSGHISDIILQPLVHQPGDKWEYGVSYDWAGMLVERLRKQSLGEYFKERIFAPLGITDMSFFPSGSMKDRLTTEEVKECFNSGGGGLFAKPGDFCKILSTLLNNGLSPQTGHRILEDKSINELFTNQIPNSQISAVKA
ncbi:hypothetical protein SI65_09612 [Aspergillus cristatus]|uniref:Beta-lactamase-related domain-containing protein n=1 Tax=Aspergillus cristatus TaxID=573508 RepID=A0A1E3B1N0_ASPCR|nr:hypothetical protein SI65_09612 [Aspergillus cristatus]